MHVIQSLLRPYRSKSSIFLIAVFFTVHLCLRDCYVDAMGVERGRGDKFIRALSDSQKNDAKTKGICVAKTDKDVIGDFCAFEILDRGAEPVGKSGPTTTADAFDVCLKFKGFKADSLDCKKIYCFSLKSSVTFWVLVVGIPVSLFIAICVIIWMFCHFSYYMCCCCIFHMELPKWFKKAQAKAKVSPEGNAPKGKKEGENATDESKDKGKENEKDGEKDKDENKDKEPEKDA